MKTKKTPGQSKAARAATLGRKRVALIQKLIKIDVKMDALRAQAKSVQFKIDNVDRVINNLGYNGE